MAYTVVARTDTPESRDPLRDLEDLVRHPGWLWLKREELAALRLDFESLIDRVCVPSDAEALHGIRRVVAARRAIERVFARPEEEIRKRRKGRSSH